MPLRACPGNTNTGLRIAVVQQYQVLQYCTGLWWETILTFHITVHFFVFLLFLGNKRVLIYYLLFISEKRKF
ncbi:hypothetical protein EB796_013252 [Bugula neritina]|uniref:Uncharacterized protein n=1 Tax=Bugula neritina TaxID=10212 RepID=A0A7J7JRZ4_BUGNE|nr:hypothetical protein EB796_013252 [Bugula neritina]